MGAHLLQNFARFQTVYVTPTNQPGQYNFFTPPMNSIAVNTMDKEWLSSIAKASGFLAEGYDFKVRFETGSSQLRTGWLRRRSQASPPWYPVHCVRTCTHACGLAVVVAVPVPCIPPSASTSPSNPLLPLPRLPPSHRRPPHRTLMPAAGGL